ncbi:hypothetical protein [Herbidospora mongoliensis]|uniref:hypothetical protein n=1 Tax=Herbidospora mongoliensis TaxID=688067 RepID=UPI00082C7E86|nr:hypothetical protein [Herbidospora mongoliensis]
MQVDSSRTNATRPIAVFFLVALSFLALATLRAASVPYWNGMFLLGLVVFGWIPMMFGFLLSLPFTAHRIGSPFLVAAPFVLMLVVMVALALDAPFQARFALSHEAMNRIVSTAGPDCQDAGLYRLCPEPLYIDEDDTPDGVRFAVDEGSLEDNRGFAYAPNGVPESFGDDDYEHLTGKWYRWKGWDGW